MNYNEFINNLTYLNQCGMWDNDGEFLHWHRVAVVTPIFKTILKDTRSLFKDEKYFSDFLFAWGEVEPTGTKEVVEFIFDVANPEEYNDDI